MLRPSNSNIKHTPTKEELRFNDNMKKHKEQINIFYNSGRKIYHVSEDNFHLKKYRFTPRESEKPRWNYSTSCSNNSSNRGGQPWRIDMTHYIKSDRQNMNRNACDIEPGYKGIMALDLSGIPHKFRAQAIEQHHKNIQEYKEEQAARPVRDRYENTVERAEKIHRIDAIAADKRRKEELDAQQLRYEHRAKGRRKFIEQKTFINDTV